MLLGGVFPEFYARLLVALVPHDALCTSAFTTDDKTAPQRNALQRMYTW